MKTAVGTLKSDLQQFRELQAFAAFGSELDAVSQAQLDRGVRLTELLKQGLNSPMPVQEQVVSIYAGTRGYLDSIPVEDVRRFESELLDWMRTRYPEQLDAIAASGNFADQEAFETALKEFATQFRTTVRAGHEPDAQPQGEATGRMVDSDTTLPERETERAGH
jgi:F-type H+-transporting ATPase subunit alpha